MLQQIRDSFSAQAFITGDLSNPWLIGVLCVCAALIVILVYLAVRAKKKHYIPHGNITDPQQIYSLLRLAQDQRRPLETQAIGTGNYKRPTFRCAITAVGLHDISLELTGLKTLSSNWIGREVQSFFRIKVDNQFTYFTFRSKIETITEKGHPFCHISISAPIMLENRQKRAFLRLSPPPDLILGAAFWYDTHMPDPDVFIDINKWPNPALFLLPGKVEQFRIVNISAGGMRIFIPRETLRNNKLAFASVEYLIILLDLFDPETNGSLRTWVHCRIQNVWEEYTTRDVFLGLQFVSWAKPKEPADIGEEPGIIDWLRLSSSHEVECLGNWIMRRHLEMFRDLPQNQD